MKKLLRLLPAIAAMLVACAGFAQPRPAPTYAWAKAYPVLPETINEGAGYYSLSVGLDGSVYIGTAKYGVNAYLVEFDPVTQRQRIVIDTHKVCGIPPTVTGFAAQASIHTRNFVGPSGKIYVGSQEGYRREQDKKDNVQYPGGYLMAYDPRIDTASNLGMPMPGQGVIDIAADEGRRLNYAITYGEQHWILQNLKTKSFRELGLRPARFASTLIEPNGRASVITRDFQLAQYDPAKDTVTVRDILLDGEKFAPANDAAIPNWTLAPDRRTAYLMLLNDPTLIRFDLAGREPEVAAKRLGKLIEGEKPDSRSGLMFGADGKLYAIVGIMTTFDGGKPLRLQHLVRFDPRGDKIENLGALAVNNPDYFDFHAKGPDGKPLPWTNGFQRLPDGTLTPSMVLGMAIAPDGAIYATAISPFTLLQIGNVRAALPEPPPTPAQAYLEFALQACDRIEANLPEITRIAEIVAQRHIAGGLIGCIYNDARWPGQGSQYEITGRSGSMMHIDFGRPWKKDRTGAEQAMDVAFIGFQRGPDAKDLELMKKEKARGAYLIGMGPRELPALAEHVALCDAWLDTGLGADDRVVSIGATKGGRGNSLMNTLHGWAFIAEVVAACTRQGKTPPMWKSYLWQDAFDWQDRYFLSKQFHDDLTLAPIPRGELTRAYLARIRYLTRRFANTQLPAVRKAADLIATEHAAGKKTIVAYKGHTLYRTVGEYEDREWAVFHGLHENLYGEVILYGKNVPADSLLLRIDYTGMNYTDWCIFMAKTQRIIHVSSPNDPAERPELEAPRNGRLLSIDMGYAFGDACVPLEGYPFPIFAPSGVMQTIAYGAINVEVLERIAARPAAEQ